MKEFFIPEPRMPTLEEHRATSAAWLKRIGSCLYENWPEALKALSFRTELVELTPADQELLWNILDGKPDVKTVRRLADSLTSSITAFDPKGCFVRLSSRSPKDWYYPGIPCLTTGDEIIDALVNSMRIVDDLMEYKYADIPCYLLLREYHQIPAEQEFRCFIREGQIVGVSQYEYRTFFPGLVRDRQAVAARCIAFLESILPKIHLQTVVIDLWLREEPLVIEINPYGLSDPCLLSYDEMETSTGLFRIVENEGAS